MKKYTVYFDQVNRTNYQVFARNESVARQKARKLYRQRLEVPDATAQEGWLVESDGEDK